MSGMTNLSQRLLLGAAIPMAMALSACSMVKKQELDDQLSYMRSEMEAERRAEIAEGDLLVSEELNGRMNGLEGRLEDLERDLAAIAEDFDAKVEELEMALRFDVPIYFGFDEDEVGPQYIPFLDRFADIVTKYYPNSIVTVEGFTDRVGTPEYNLALGKRRAESVGTYLANHRGLGNDRVRAVSYGEAAERQVSSDSHGPGQEGWENRRVALVIDHSGN